MGEYAVNCVYGDAIAEFSILDERETTLLEFVCCLSKWDCLDYCSSFKRVDCAWLREERDGTEGRGRTGG